jgi:hypothetical protein
MGLGGGRSGIHMEILFKKSDVMAYFSVFSCFGRQAERFS